MKSVSAYYKLKFGFFVYKNSDFPFTKAGLVSNFTDKKKLYCTRIQDENFYSNTIYENVSRSPIGPLLATKRMLITPLTVTRPVISIEPYKQIKLFAGNDYWLTLDSGDKNFSFKDNSTHKKLDASNSKGAKFQIGMNDARYTKICANENLTIKPIDQRILLNSVKNHTKKKSHIHYIFIDSLPYFNKNVNQYLYYLFEEFFSFEKNRIVLDNYFVQSDWTTPSLATLLLGLPAHQHGVIGPGSNNPAKNVNEVIRTNNKTFFEVSEKCGFTNTVISSNPRMNPFYGYARGVQNFYHKSYMNCENVLSLWKKEVAQNVNRNSIFFLNFFDIHHPLSQNLEYDKFINLSKILRQHEKAGQLDLHSWSEPIDLFITTRKLFQSISQYCIEVDKSNPNVDHVFILTSDHSNVGTWKKGTNKGHLKSSRFHVPYIVISSQLPNSIHKIPELINSSTVAQLFISAFSKDLFDLSKFSNELVKYKNLEGYVYSEVIYPGQTYRVQLFFKEYNYFLESKDIIKNNTINLRNPEIRTFDKITNKFIDNNSISFQVTKNFISILKKYSAFKVIVN
jgi:uncharacterized protein YacL (UPF0231 family)